MHRPTLLIVQPPVLAGFEAAQGLRRKQRVYDFISTNKCAQEVAPDAGT